MDLFLAWVILSWKSHRRWSVIRRFARINWRGARSLQSYALLDRSWRQRDTYAIAWYPLSDRTSWNHLVRFNRITIRCYFLYRLSVLLYVIVPFLRSQANFPEIDLFCSILIKAFSDNILIYWQRSTGIWRKMYVQIITIWQKRIW